MADSFNPFASLGDLFGKPASLRAQEEANAGALQRAGIAAGTAANALAEQRRQFDSQGQIIMAAAKRWQELVNEQGPTITIGAPGTTALDVQQNPMGGGGLGGTDAALRKFVQTPEFMMLPRAGIKYDDMIKALQQNPAALEQFTLAPGAQRFESAPGGQARMVAQNTNQPPRMFESSTDRAAVDVLKQRIEKSPDADTLLEAVDNLERAALDPNASRGMIASWWAMQRARLGMPAGNNAREVAEAMRNRLISSMRVAGEGPMTDSDAQRYRDALASVDNDPGAVRTILDVQRKYLRRIQARVELGQEALASGDIDKVRQAISSSTGPAVDARLWNEDKAWFTSRFGQSLESIRNRDDLRALLSSLPPSTKASPRAVRILRELETRLSLDHN